MNEVHTVVSCCTCSLVGRRICATYQIFARRHRYTYCILCAGQRIVACARTARKAPVHLSLTYFAMVSILDSQDRYLIVKLNSECSCCVRPTPMGRAFDFCELSLAPVAFS